MRTLKLMWKLWIRPLFCKHDISLFAVCMVMKSFYMDGNAVCGDAANVIR